MELKKSWYYWLISLSVLMLFSLGSWWLFLVFKLANKLTSLDHPALEGNLISMVKWEGATFLVLLFVLVLTLAYIYWRDLKKTKALQAFFAALTHELKTPLASMKLQSEVLAEQLEDLKITDEQKKTLQTYTHRLTNDSITLEDQLDNHLQLSRIERNSPLNLTRINLDEFLVKQIDRYKNLPKVKLENMDHFVLADDFALQTIFRNLFENTLQHNKNPEGITIVAIEGEHSICLTFEDTNSKFSGDTSQLGKLFYKFNSPKGSGIGLYLTKELLHKMGGKFSIITEPHFKHVMHFPKAKT